MRSILLILTIFINTQFTFSQTEASESIIDGITEKTIMKERKFLAHPPIREADIFWEKKIWRVIDVREKMNLPFMYPEMPFFEILKSAAMNGELTLYSGNDDKFSKKVEDFEGIFYAHDTVEVIDEDFNVTFQPITNDFGFEDVKRFRVKEIWYFDEAHSTMRVRIIGIAPMKDIYDDNGNFRHEKPLFWVYYPHLRNVLARQQAFVGGNDNNQVSWDDLFEMRYFASVIYKESNVYDRRIKDYQTGLDQLLEADKIKEELFNFEHDLWTY